MGSGESTSEIAPGVRVGGAGIRFQYARSSGPGGQNVNKLNTKAELWIALEDIDGLSHAALDRLRKLAGASLTMHDEIHLSNDSTRSQSANRRLLLEALRQLILRARREPKIRRKTKPTGASIQRRLQHKHRRSQIKGSRKMIDE